MKLRDLRDQLNNPRMECHLDDEVLVLLSEPSVGPSATSPVKSASVGWAWDKGSFLLRPVDDLVRRTENQALWQAARDLLFILSGESRHYRGAEHLTGLAKDVREIFKRFGIRPRKVGSFLPEE